MARSRKWHSWESDNISDVNSVDNIGLMRNETFLWIATRDQSEADRILAQINVRQKNRYELAWAIIISILPIGSVEMQDCDDHRSAAIHSILTTYLCYNNNNMIRQATKNKLRIFQNSKDAYALLSLTYIYISSTPSTCSSSFFFLFIGSFQISFNQLVVVAVSCVVVVVVVVAIVICLHTTRIRNSITVWMKAKIA